MASLALAAWVVFGSGLVGPLRRAEQAAWPAAGLIAALGLGMTLWDLAFMRSWRANLTGPEPQRRSGRRARVLRKWLGLQATVAALALVYGLLREYRSPLYQPFFSVALTLWPWLAAAAVPYIAWVDARMAEPRDLYWRIGHRLLGGAWQRTPAAEWRAFVLGWVVKGFFLPLMFGYAAQQLVALSGQLSAAPAAAGGLASAGAIGAVARFRPVFEAVFTGCYFVDVIWGATGYLWSLRLTDSHVRSTDATAGGWIAALACYEPFSKGLWPAFFAYGSDRAWGYWMGDSPTLYVAWGMAILLLLMVYTTSTMAFGLRFSNLSHRGIISHGPYRWMRHPAYVSKNLSWWLISLPFLAGPTALDSLRLCAMLLAVNALYAWRAHTESRHLSADPAYRAYCAEVKQRQRHMVSHCRALWPGLGGVRSAGVGASSAAAQPAPAERA